MTLQDRQDSYAGLQARRSYRAITVGMHRPTSTISREVRRNGDREHYRLQQAEQAAAPVPGARKHRNWLPGRCWPSPSPTGCNTTAGHPDRSPPATTGIPHDAGMRICHEPIYRSLYVRSRGEFRHELTRYLLRRQPHTRTHEARGLLPDAVPLSERPAEAADRAVLLGHRNPRVLLPPAPLATRQQRKHQPTAPRLPARRGRPVPTQSRGPRYHRQHAPPHPCAHPMIPPVSPLIGL
ncbi:helix-turn-helix domain-containing protein [Actinopolyspora sp. BKK1]|nr:helix-turn-helix domain-containing protein [Actinopolyspora sp. BKK2]NHE78438.1 helix-turn-helix domain-containing protein [Actinopolyspora sp. BKK1]